MTTFPYLTVLTLLPVLAATLVVLLPSRAEALARRVAAVLSGCILLDTLWLWHRFNPANASMQFDERHAWILLPRIDYHVAIDGMGLLMLVLSAIVVMISIGASASTGDRQRLYFALIFVLQSFLFGAFTALNFIHWFTYWELTLVPAFFLIKLWGGPNRSKAATQFLVYTMTGSVGMLIGFIALYAGAGTFDFVELAGLARAGQLMPSVLTALHPGFVSPALLPMLIFVGVLVGFAVKVPLIPFHTWLPDTYAEAPTGVTILLTGAMSKMGVYGFLRVVLPIFGPQMQRMLTPLLILAAATVVLSTLAALAQKDLKRIFAYSSVNHLGYCLLAIFALSRPMGLTDGSLVTKQAAMSGVLLQMFNHGLTAATIFWFLAMLERRSGGKLGVDEFGGLRKVAPVLTGLMGIALFSSLGLPGLNGFIGEFLIFRGAFALAPIATATCLLGLLMTVILILGVIQKVFTGPLRPDLATFADLSGWERMALFPAIALMFVLGLYPQLILGTLSTSIFEMIRQLSL